MFASNTASMERQHSYLESLPSELLFLIQGNLDRRGLSNLSLTSRSMNRTASEQLYRTFEYYQQRFTPLLSLGPFVRALESRPFLRDYVRNIFIDERAYSPALTTCEINDKLTTGREIGITALKWTSRLINACPNVANLHLSLLPAIEQGRDQRMTAFNKDGWCPGRKADDFHGFPRLTNLSLDFSSCNLLEDPLRTFPGFLSILSISSLRILTIKDLPRSSSPAKGHTNTIPSLQFWRWVSPDSPSWSCPIEELQIQGDCSGICSHGPAFGDFISHFPRLHTLRTYTTSSHTYSASSGRNESSPHKTGPCNVGAIPSILSKLPGVSDRIQHLTICADLVEDWIQDVDFSSFKNLKTLKVPASYSCLKQEVDYESLSSRLPGNLRSLGTYISHCGWDREMDNITKKRRKNTKTHWQQFSSAPHLKFLETVEYIDYATEMYNNCRPQCANPSPRINKRCTVYLRPDNEGVYGENFL